MQGPAVPSTAAADGTASTTQPADDKENNKKDKKKDKKGGAGGASTLGKGSSLIRSAVEASAVPNTEGVNEGHSFLNLSSESADTVGESNLQGVASLLDPLGDKSGKLLDELRGVIEANQVSSLR